MTASDEALWAIIWDDMLLANEIDLDDDRIDTLSLYSGIGLVEDVPEWFQRNYKWVELEVVALR